MLTGEILFKIEEYATELGFGLFGVVPAEIPKSYQVFLDWISQGNHASMRYLSDRSEARSHPKFVLKEAKSIIVLGAGYKQVFEEFSLHFSDNAPNGRIAKYALGTDYHDWFRPRMKKLGKYLQTFFPEIRTRGVVDTAPIMERQFTFNAGFGWFGRNSMLINPEFGSRFFIGLLLVSEPVSAEVTPSEFDGCGNCKKCIEACPCGAIGENRTIDARKCINFWTIETSDEIPLEIREKLDGRLFGCDTCQDVCPWNVKIDSEHPGKCRCEACGTYSNKFTASASKDVPSKSGKIALETIETLDETTFEKMFGKTPLSRPGLKTLQRNAGYLRPE